jgi:hypothetical protein
MTINVPEQYPFLIWFLTSAQVKLLNAETTAHLQKQVRATKLRRRKAKAKWAAVTRDKHEANQASKAEARSKAALLKGTGSISQLCSLVLWLCMLPLVLASAIPTQAPCCTAHPLPAGHLHMMCAAIPNSSERTSLLSVRLPTQCSEQVRSAGWLSTTYTTTFHGYEFGAARPRRAAMQQRQHQRH